MKPATPMLIGILKINISYFRFGAKLNAGRKIPKNVVDKEYSILKGYTNIPADRQ